MVVEAPRGESERGRRRPLSVGSAGRAQGLRFSCKNWGLPREVLRPAKLFKVLGAEH